MTLSTSNGMGTAPSLDSPNLTREQAEERAPMYELAPDDCSPEQRAYEATLPEPAPIPEQPF